MLVKNGSNKQDCAKRAVHKVLRMSVYFLGGACAAFNTGKNKPRKNREE